MPRRCAFEKTRNFNEIPSQFQDTYNVKYSTNINIDLSTNINTQPIRFYKNPTIEAEEKVKARIVETPVTTTIILVFKLDINARFLAIASL